MKETNIRIVEFGPDLKLFVRRIALEGSELTPKQIQSVCSQIGRRYNVAATPDTNAQGKQQILVYQYDNVPTDPIAVDNWTVTPSTDNERLVLNFSVKEHQQLGADLYKQSLILQLRQNPEFWTLDSPRIFYQKHPIKLEASDNPDIDAFRRFEISEVIIDGVGLGLAVEISTAFFTNLSVDDYLSKGHGERFGQLSGRQGEQQGTLMYDGPNKRVKCYYVRYHKELTLSTGHSFRTNNGKQYDTPYEYFKDCYPNFEVMPTDRVARVSFPGMDGAVEVAANRLYLRVMNSMLPRRMKNIDKIVPAEREKLLTEEFWNKLGSTPFGKGFRNVKKGYYNPPSEKSGIVPMVDLKFGKGAILQAPKKANVQSYRDHFRKRKEWLNSKGCFHVPPQMERRILIAYPNGLSEQVVEKYADDLCEKVTQLTAVPVEPIIMRPYDSVLEAAYQLREETENGMVLFIFDRHDPATYYHISQELKGQRLKRATSKEMLRKYRGFANNYKGRGIKDWESYIDLTAYDVIEQLGCVPYVMNPVFNYDMQLVIDVSEKSSHFGLSLMLYNKHTNIPLFRCQVHRKHDPKNKETINKVLLEKHFTTLFSSIKPKLEQSMPTNLLVLRDGKDCGEEYQAIASVIDDFKARNVLGQSFYFDYAEYHKTSRKGIRIWERNMGEVENALEGSYTLLDKNQAVLNLTGGGTLRQGTASPILIVAKYSPNIDIKKVTEDVFISSQLNYPSPGVAQRLTYAAKRVDNQLAERRAQEVERIK